MSTAAVNTIAKEELLNDIETNVPVQIVNVLAPEYYDRGTIRGSKKIPLSELGQRIGELDKSVEVVTYCANTNCMASEKAAEKLTAHGFRVRAYKGGIDEWNASHLPLD